MTEKSGNSARESAVPSEVDRVLSEVETAIWETTGSAFMSGEGGKKGNRRYFYLSLCKAGNTVAHARELIRSTPSSATQPALSVRTILDIIFEVESHTYRQVDWKNNVLKPLREALKSHEAEVNRLVGNSVDGTTKGKS